MPSKGLAQTSLSDASSSLGRVGLHQPVDRLETDRTGPTSAGHYMPLAKRNQPLSGEQKHQNRQWPSVRSTVEQVFGILKQHYRVAKARYLGLKRQPSPWPMLAAVALQHQTRRGCPGRGDGFFRITPPNGRKATNTGQGIMKNGAANTYSSRILPVKADGYPKKSAFD